MLDIESGDIEYTNAGHNPAIVVRGDGEPELLGPTGMPIGLMPEATYGSVPKRPTWDKGDTLVLYTDGITEAENPEGEEFGTRPARRCLPGSQGEQRARAS